MKPFFNLSVLAVSFCALSASAQFLPGNLAVVQVGDGSAALTGVGTAVFIDEFTPLGTLANTYALPTSGGNAFVMTGSATAEGALSRSPNGSQINIAGYNVALPFASSPASATGVAAPRALGALNAAGTFSIPGTSTTAFSGNGFRGSASDGSGNYWGVANGGGVYYFGTGGAAGTIAATPANNRVMNIANNNLLFTSGSTTIGLYSFTGQPNSASAATLMINTSTSGTGTASPYDFALNAAGTTAYISDDRTIANGGGIQRWDLSGGVWSLSYTLTTGAASTSGTRGLAVDFSGPSAVIYATTTESNNNRLIGIVDTGALSVGTTLASAGVNKAFRGLDFAPVAIPEPSSLALAGLGLLGAALFRRRNK